MNAFLPPVGRILLILGAMVGGPAAAAPALKTKPPADGPVDLAALHQLVEKAEAGSEFPEASVKRVKDALSQLVARVDAVENPPAGYAKGRKLPPAFDQVKSATVEEKAAVIQKKNVLAVGREARMVQSSGCVLIVAGDAEVIQSNHCVVIAGGNVKLIQSGDCVVVAGRALEMTQCFSRRKGAGRAGAGDDPEPAGTLAVAGERLKCGQSDVAIGVALRPVKDASGAGVRSSQSKDLLFLNAPDDWTSLQDKDCRAEPPRSPVAK